MMEYIINREKIKTIISKSLSLFLTKDINKILGDYKYLQQYQKRYAQILKIIPKCSMGIFAIDLSNIIKRALRKNLYTQEQVEKNLLLVFEYADDDTKMFISKLFYFTQVMTDDISKALVDFAMQTANKNYRYWTTSDISKITFMLQKGIYPEYYNDRRLLLEKIAIESDFKINKNVDVSTSKTKLCIVSYLLDDDLYNSMQRVTMMLANGLIDYFDEILVLTLDSFYVSESDKMSINTIFKRPLSAKKAEGIRKMFNEKVKIEFVSDGSFKHRYQNALDIIYQYKPKIILDISDEYSPISYFYSKDFLTFYMPMRNCASSSFFDYILGFKWQYNKKSNIYNSVEENEVVEWLFPEFVPEDRGIEFNRKDLGISEEAFILLSVGNNATALDNTFVDNVCKLLDENSNFVWLLVGSGAPEYLHINYSGLLDNKRIIEWGFEKNLMNLCKICNVLLRANVTGGSGATAIAAMQGLPICMTKYVCDPMRWLQLDYSKIETYEELMIYISRLSKDSMFYKRESERTLAKVNMAVDAKAKWAELSEIFKEKMKTFEKGDLYV